MATRIITFFSAFIPNEYLLCALLTAIPVTEIKGAILFAVSAGANPLLSFLTCCFSSLIFALFLAKFFPVLIEKIGKNKNLKRVTDLVTSRLSEKADRIRDGRERSETDRMFALFTFVALPLPLTGIWAGSLLGAMLKIPYGKSVFALTAGNFTAGGIVLFLSLVAGERASLVLEGFLFVALLAIFIMFGKHLIKNGKAKKGRDDR